MNAGKIVRDLARDERGAALAETVIVAPLLVLLLVGLIEVGRFGDYTIKVANAARAGVQYGAQGDIAAADTPGIQAAALTDAQNVPGVAAPTVSTFCQCADGSASACGDQTACSASHRVVYVQVTVTGTLPSLLNFPGLPDSLRTVTVSNTATMRVAQ